MLYKGNMYSWIYDTATGKTAMMSFHHKRAPLHFLRTQEHKFSCYPHCTCMVDDMM